MQTPASTSSLPLLVLVAVKRAWPATDVWSPPTWVTTPPADDPAGDFFLLEISTDGGTSYSTLASTGDVATNAAWSEATTTLAAGSTVKFRVQVSDGTADGSLVEGGVDDLLICPSATASVPLLPPLGWAVLLSGLVYFGARAADRKFENLWND